MKLTLGNLGFVESTINFQDSKLNSITSLKEEVKVVRFL